MFANHQMASELGWELKINVNELDIIERSIRVTSDTHIGSVIYKLVEQLNSASSSRQDWSDFALWWPAKNQWIHATKMTLDQYGIQADAILQFTRKHKVIKLKLPDQQLVDLSVDFSVDTFSLVKKICKDIGIRHAEECSLLRCANATLSKNSTKTNSKNGKMKASKTTLNDEERNARRIEDEFINTLSQERSKNQEVDSFSSHTSSTLNNSSSNHSSSNKFARERSNSLNGSISNAFLSSSDTQSFSYSPVVTLGEYLSNASNNVIKYKNIFDKCRINSKWLDSCKSLMEQNIKEYDLIQLRFKYFAFYDLNAKQDSTRINQIYEQAKWSVLSEAIDCTEQELINFAALQLQIQLQTKSILTCSNVISNTLNNTLLDSSFTSSSMSVSNRNLNQRPSDTMASSRQVANHVDQDDGDEDEDDVDTALSKLEKSLDVVELTHANHSTETLTKSAQTKQPAQNIDSVINELSNELCGELYLMKQQKYTFKKFKTHYFTLDDAHYLSYYKSKEESTGKPIDKVNLKGSEIAPDVNVAARKFGINIRVPTHQGLTELNIRCPNEEAYAQWMSACKLASKNKSLSDPAFAIEVKSILNLLQIQMKKPISNFSLNTNDKTASIFSSSSMNVTDSNEVQASNLLPMRMQKKYKLKQLNDRILEAYSTISDLDVNESKWKYIMAWQALPTYGMSYFVIKLKGSRYREDILGVSSTRLFRISPEGEVLKSWRYNTMQSWNVNWETKQFEILFDNEQLIFLCLSCDSKILHEFIGAYIFLSLRNEDNMPSDEMFYKLTKKQ